MAAASVFVKTCFLPTLLILTSMSAMSVKTVACVELLVGGDKGWATPSSKNEQLYNDWASNNRFKVNDTLRFEYQKDSVLVVTEEEYDRCRSSHPVFFSNNGDTTFTLDRPGLFYFISGVSGHCQRGLKMIVKVLEIESPPPAAPVVGEPAPDAAAVSSPKRNAATELRFGALEFVLVTSFVGAFLFM